MLTYQIEISGIFQDFQGFLLVRSKYLLLISSLDTLIMSQSQIKGKFFLQYCDFSHLRTITDSGAHRRTRRTSDQAALYAMKTHIYGLIAHSKRTDYAQKCALEDFTKFAHTPTSTIGNKSGNNACNNGLEGLVALSPQVTTSNKLVRFYGSTDRRSDRVWYFVLTLTNEVMSSYLGSLTGSMPLL